jgi:DNA-binding MarR family transcriptional regulator
MSSAEQSGQRRSGASLGWSLAMVLRRWQERVEQALESIPHGSRGFHVLSVVVHDELPTQGALAVRLGIDRTVLTYLIDDLETAGLVERQLDRRDRRARRIVATEEGRRVLTEAEHRVADSEEQVLGGLNESERVMFRDTAERAAEAIHAAAPDTDPCRAVEDCEPIAVDQLTRPASRP